jgi:nucleotide-binding universal stress UspA family protein
MRRAGGTSSLRRVVNLFAKAYPQGMMSSPAHVSPFAVVVGNDFSEASGFAFDQAARVARRIPGSEIHVVHVIEGSSTDEETKRVSDLLLTYLQDKVTAIGGLEDQAVGLHVRCGRPAREIAQIAKDVSADLIVVGIRKGPHLKQLLVGPVTERLLAASPCPVLAAGPMPTPRDDAHEPSIDPPCPDCLQSRRETAGREWWCSRHAGHHAAAHSYSFQRALPLRTHDSAVLPTGVD